MTSPILTVGDAVLSVRAPWGLLFFPGFGDKDIENRDRSTRRRGHLWIHISRTMTRREYEECAAFVLSIGRSMASELEVRALLGKIIGSVEIEDCVRRSSSPWFFGPHGFVLRDPQRIQPVEALGRLGFWAYQVQRGTPERLLG